MSAENEEQPPLILCATMDDDSQNFFDALRALHFPPARNFLKAHLTLFHALPFDGYDAACRTISDTATVTPLMAGQIVPPRFLGRGVAYPVICPALVKLHSDLTSIWKSRLTAQDNQGFRPHITIQNKVDPSAARILHTELAEYFQPRPIEIRGLTLWYYECGPWRFAKAWEFSG